MTERTFRSPSPHGGGRRTSQDVGPRPPVPSIPVDLRALSPPLSPKPTPSYLDKPSSPPPAASTGPATALRNPQDLEATRLMMPGFRVASEKIGREDEPSWFLASKHGDFSSLRVSDAPMKLPTTSVPVAPDARPVSPGSSVNFSYPSRSRPMSPSSPVPGRPSLTFEASPSGQGHRRVVSASSQTSSREPSVAKPKKQRPVSTSALSSTAAVTAPAEADQTLVYDPNTRRLRPRWEMLELERQLQESQEEEAPAETRKEPKKKHKAPSRVGSHHAKGTMDRSQGALVEESAAGQKLLGQDSEMPHAPVEEEKVRVGDGPSRRDKRETSRSGSEATAMSPPPPQLSTKQPAASHHTRSSYALGRKPSTVKEEPEPDVSQTALHPAPSRLRDAQVPTKQSDIRGGLSSASHTESEPLSRVGVRRTPAIELPAGDTASWRHSTSSPDSYKAEPEMARISKVIREDRAPSTSPVQTAHFWAVPARTGTLSVVKHEPPPRSVSPMKSAMKQPSHSPRGPSPATDTTTSESGAQEQAASTVAGDTGVGRRELSPSTLLPRKKSVRVSWDDQNTAVVGHAASPVDDSDRDDNDDGESNASPLVTGSETSSKKPWFANVISRASTGKKILSPLGGGDETEVMHPRPALPSFGSIRDRKPRELGGLHHQPPEERALVRPPQSQDPNAYSPSLPATPVNVPSVAASLEEPGKLQESLRLGMSSDQVIGHLLASVQQQQQEEEQQRQQQQEESFRRQEANTSRFREPLPPVVTSVEGTGYHSDSSSSSSSNDFGVSGGPSAFETSTTRSSLMGMENVAGVPEETPQPPWKPSSEVAVTPVNGSTKSRDKSPTRTAVKEPLPQPQTVDMPVPFISISSPSPVAEKPPDVEPSTGPPIVDKLPEVALSTSSSVADKLPEVAPSPSSPVVDKVPELEPSTSYLDVPGAFPADSSDEDQGVGAARLPEEKMPEKMSGGSTTTPDTRPRGPTAPGPMQPQPPSVTKSHVAIMPPHFAVDPDESEGESIYSDAYEDLSELDGEGFMSLNAVVESPITTPVKSKGLFETRQVTISPPTRASEAPIPVLSEASGSQPQLQTTVTDESWEAAKAFWRNLSVEKRRQLEREAMEEAGAEADLDEVSQPPKKAKKKKSVERRAAEISALQQGHSEQSERVYMIQPGTKLPPEPTVQHLRPTMRNKQPPPIAEAPGLHLKRSLRPEDKPPSQAAAGSSVVRGAVAELQHAEPSAHVHKPKARLSKHSRPTSLQMASGVPTAVSRQVTGPSDQHKRTMSLDTGALAGLRAAEAQPVHHVPAANSTLASMLRPSLRRRGSTSSESSFKRTRAPTLQNRGFLNKSLRNTSPPPSRDSARDGLAKRFSLRSLSPAGSPFRRTTSAGSPPPVSFNPTLRRSLRRSSDGSIDSTHRGTAAERISSLGRDAGHRIAGVLGGSSAKKGKAKKDEARFKSRFGDSSDEDVAHPRPAFQSRFADSSDEDENDPSMVDSPLQPPRAGALPRSRAGGDAKEGVATTAIAVRTQQPEESSDLPDSDDEEQSEVKLASPGPSVVIPSSPPDPRLVLAQTNSGSLGTATLRRQRSGRGVALQLSSTKTTTSTAQGAATVTTTTKTSVTAAGAGGGLSSKNVRHHSLMSILRRRKHDPSGAGRIQRAELTESAARRDTKLERSLQELAAIRSSGAGNEYGRLHKRPAEDPAWPLPQGRIDITPAGRSRTDDNKAKAVEAGIPEEDDAPLPPQHPGHEGKEVDERHVDSGRDAKDIGRDTAGAASRLPRGKTSTSTAAGLSTVTTTPRSTHAVTSDSGRPRTAGGLLEMAGSSLGGTTSAEKAAEQRPTVDLQRRSMSLGLVGVATTTASDASATPAEKEARKKKKFAGLRRMFGLYD